MTIHRLSQRLQDAGHHLRNRAYARLAVLGAGPPRPEDQVVAERLFCELTDWEAAARTPLETVLAWLPQGVVREIRQELGVTIAVEGEASWSAAGESAGPALARGGGRPPVSRVNLWVKMTRARLIPAPGRPDIE